MWVCVRACTRVFAKLASEVQGNHLPPQCGGYICVIPCLQKGVGDLNSDNTCAAGPLLMEPSSQPLVALI